MSRRRSAPWAATGVPDARRQWCRALDLTVERHARGLEPRPGAGTGERIRARRLRDELAAAIEVMRTESEALQAADLYWASRDMVDVAVDAAPGLPEWTPGLATPCANGLLCWAKPAGSVPYSGPGGGDTDVPWDGVWWWTRADGRLQLIPASRFTGHTELLDPYEVSTPLWAAGYTLLLDPDRPRTEEADGVGDVHPLISVVGAAWLLMGQPNVTETRVIADQRPIGGPPSAPAAPDPRTTPRVTLVDVRRPARSARDESVEHAARRFGRRWWVGGHWRQQACGAGLAQRRPTWIAPYVKGPVGAPLVSDRVFVWRR